MKKHPVRNLQSLFCQNENASAKWMVQLSFRWNSGKDRERSRYKSQSLTHNGKIIISPDKIGSIIAAWIPANTLPNSRTSLISSWIFRTVILLKEKNRYRTEMVKHPEYKEFQ